MQSMIHQVQPYLHVSVRKNVFVIQGKYILAQGNKFLDEYFVLILIHQDFPRIMPSVWEVGGRIPRTLERHMFANGKACLYTPEEYYWKWNARGDFTMRAFLEGPARHFFIGQSIVELGGVWPAGDRAHGYRGLFEWYKETTGVNDDNLIAKFVYALSKNLKGHHLCPCGSGLFIRRCHSILIKIRNQVPNEIIKFTLSSYTEERRTAQRTRRLIRYIARKARTLATPKTTLVLPSGTRVEGFLPLETSQIDALLRYQLSSP